MRSLARRRGLRNRAEATMLATYPVLTGGTEAQKSATSAASLVNCVLLCD